MEIRKVNRDEWSDVNRLHSVVFNSKAASVEAKDEDAPRFENAWGAIEGGVLCSAMTSHEFAMMHDGAYVPMAGIGGVGTFPEYRRRGHVRRLFEAVFVDMREKGQLFSTLYPFSFPYYRMFGYELVYSTNEFTLPLDAIDLTRRSGAIELVTEPTAEMRRVYESFVGRRNLAMERTDALWSRRMRYDSYADQVFTYLLRDESGRARAYFTFHAKPAGEHQVELRFRDLAFVDEQSLAMLLPHVAGFYPRAVSATFRLPTDVPLDPLIDEPYEITHVRSASLMGRVVDAAGALGATAWPGEGRLAVAVVDGDLAWNNGTFEVEWGAGSARVARASKSPDVSVDVRALAPLVCGYADGVTAQRYGRLESTLSQARLAELFPSKPLYQNDHF